MEKFWREAVLDHFPHGEDGSLVLDKDGALKMIDILMARGYAVCLTGGDIGDEIRVSWIFAGDTDNLKYPDYANIVFTSADYLYDYPMAAMEADEDESDDIPEDTVKDSEKVEDAPEDIPEDVVPAEEEIFTVE